MYGLTNLVLVLYTCKCAYQGLQLWLHCVKSHNNQLTPLFHSDSQCSLYASYVNWDCWFMTVFSVEQNVPVSLKSTHEEIGGQVALMASLNLSSCVDWIIITISSRLRPQKKPSKRWLRESATISWILLKFEYTKAVEDGDTTEWIMMFGTMVKTNRLKEQLTFALKDYMAWACVSNKRLRDTLLALCIQLASPWVSILSKILKSIYPDSVFEEDTIKTSPANQQLEAF